MSYVFYPGCSLESTAKDYALSTNAVAAALGIDLPELAGWTCCGSTAAHQTDALLALALPAANLAAASGKTVAVACAACYSRLKTANHEIVGDANSRRLVADALGADYDGSTPVKHVLEILRDDIGMAAIADKVKKPLAGLRVAAYYGCLLVRPAAIMRFDDAENPTIIDKLMTATGAEAIDWPAKTDCCGASFSITKTEIVLRLSRAILTAAREAGADCIVTACPLCQFNLDLRQSDIEKRNSEHFGLPVFYFTQLLGLALGLPPQRLGLQSLLVDPLPLLTRKGIVQPEKAVAR
ncbi:MAG: CoB--CoM heterodisulfide reductase iron-sulfur subunit B family protein [Dehalococcoidia bacterium]